jgi:hypothetical protein
MRRILLLITILFFISVTLSCADSNDKLMSLSGTLYRSVKYFESYYIELDGSLNRFYLRGEALKEIEEGTRILVKGIIKTYSHINKAGEVTAMPNQWVIYMDVKEVRVVDKPFGIE